jgi:hypothetical protein
MNRNRRIQNDRADLVLRHDSLFRLVQRRDAEKRLIDYSLSARLTTTLLRVSAPLRLHFLEKRIRSLGIERLAGPHDGHHVRVAHIFDVVRVPGGMSITSASPRSRLPNPLSLCVSTLCVVSLPRSSGTDLALSRYHQTSTPSCDAVLPLTTWLGDVVENCPRPAL